MKNNTNKDIIIINAHQVNEILENKQEQIINLVKDTYITHRNGDSSLPFSVFLRFPGDDSNRIIGLPAYLGGSTKVAGMKWISSFPINVNDSTERASAVTIINNMKNGRCETILEGSIISAKRTAASAALAASVLHNNKKETILGVVGCGRISEEIIRFLRSIFSDLKEIVLYDCKPEAMDRMAKNLLQNELNITKVNSIDEVFKLAKLVSFATTASMPYINNMEYVDENTTILNISLRDFSPDFIQYCDNVVDDIDHVLREKTSVHLTETKLNNRDFIRCTLADILENREINRTKGKTVVFSPFGLGVLDMALADYVKKEAISQKLYMEVSDFYL